MRKICFLFGLGLIAGCAAPEPKKDRPPPLVSVAPAAAHNFVDRYDAVGTAVANEQVTITAPVNERIERLGFSDGDYVRRGQMLAVLAQGQESATLGSAAARAREAEQQLARIESLRQRGFATKAALDTQVALLAQARGAAGQARADIADRVIRAPFSGFVSLRRISVGAVVSAGSAIATLSDISTIKLDFTIPETMLSAVRIGQTITATAAAFPGAPVSGTISAIDPQIDPQSRAVTLRALVANRGGRLKPGMLLNVAISSRARTATAVPELAIVREGSASFVYTVGGDGKAKRLPVTTGARDGDLIEIVTGLGAGTSIVTEGVVKLSEGIKVRTGADRAPAAKDAAASAPARS